MEDRLVYAVTNPVKDGTRGTRLKQLGQLIGKGGVIADRQVQRSGLMAGTLSSDPFSVQAETAAGFVLVALLIDQTLDAGKAWVGFVHV